MELFDYITTECVNIFEDERTNLFCSIADTISKHNRRLHDIDIKDIPLINISVNDIIDAAESLMYAEEVIQDESHPLYDMFQRQYEVNKKRLNLFEKCFIKKGILKEE